MAVRILVTSKRSGVCCGWHGSQLARLRLAELLAGAAEAPFPPAVGGEGILKRGGVEIRPQRIREIQFRISKLPEQEVADALLAARTDEQVGLGCVAHRQ